MELGEKIEQLFKANPDEKIVEMCVQVMNAKKEEEAGTTFSNTDKIVEIINELKEQNNETILDTFIITASLLPVELLLFGMDKLKGLVSFKMIMDLKNKAKKLGNENLDKLGALLALAQLAKNCKKEGNTDPIKDILGNL